MQPAATEATLDEPFRERLLVRLRELGLSSYAARAYLAVLDEPTISAGKICKLTGIPDSKIYYALEELMRHQLVIVQQGNPSLYRPVDLKQAEESLKREAEENFSHRVRTIEALAKDIGPLLASRGEESNGVELAYIVKGKRSILAHMKRAIEAAREEVLLMNSGSDLLEGLLPALEEAQKRGLKVRVAVYGDPIEVRELRFTEVKISNCDCNVLITDSKRLVTVARHNEENAYAIITEDPNMMSISRSFYDNPSCCFPIQIRSPARSKS